VFIDPETRAFDLSEIGNYFFFSFKKRNEINSAWQVLLKVVFSTNGRCTSLYRAVVAASRFVLQHM
jgi:hypothetical protein